MKRNEVKLPFVRQVLSLKLADGVATVIGKRPKYCPYINIDDAEGNLVVSLDPRQMESLIKKWKAANNERRKEWKRKYCHRRIAEGNPIPR